MVSSGSLNNSPPLPLSTLSASGSFNISSSGSLQSRLSSFNSEQRLRSLPSVTDDLEKQVDSDSDDEVDDDDDSRKIAVEERFWLLLRVFVRFSALLFPILALADFGFLSRRPSADLFSGDNNTGLYCCQRIRVPADGLVRVLTLSLGKRTALVQDNHSRSSTFAIPLLHLRRLLQLTRSYGLRMAQLR